MAKSSIKYMLLCSVFLLGIFFISIGFGSNPLIDIRHFIFDVAVFFLFIFFAGKEFKDFNNGGFLHFWQGISIGFLVVIPAVIIFSLALYVIFELNPELIEGYKTGARAFLKEREDFFLEEFSPGQLKEQFEAIEDTTGLDLVLSTLGKKFFAGFFVTPVVSIILRKKPK